MITLLHEAPSMYDGYGVLVSNQDESWFIWSRDKANARKIKSYINKLTTDPFFDPYEESDSLEEFCYVVEEDLAQVYNIHVTYNDVSDLEMSNDVLSVDGDNFCNIIGYVDL